MTTEIAREGQSNALGFGLTAADVPAYLAGPMAGVTVNGATLQAGVNTGTAANPQAWGPEVMFGKLYTLDHSDGINFTLFAKGSTGLASDPGAQDWSPGSAGDLYDQGIALLAGKTINGVLWMQGETDATAAGPAAAYGTNLTDLFANFRADLGAGVPIIFGEVNQNTTSLAYADTVRAGQAAVDAGDANAWMTDSEGVFLQADGIHYSAFGQVVLGGEMYAAWNTVAKTTAGTAGADLVGGSRYVDSLFAGDGDDLIFAGPGNDVAHGNAGNDSNFGGAGEDWVYGGKGNDLLFGGADHDLVYGDLDNDTCHGGDGVDWVRGGQGQDSLSGGAGDDWMSGDKGNDTLVGGAGADTFNFFATAGQDRILDFNRAEGDRLQIEDHTGFSVAHVGGDTVVTLTTGDAVVLVGVTLAGTDWIIA